MVQKPYTNDFCEKNDETIEDNENDLPDRHHLIYGEFPILSILFYA